MDILMKTKSGTKQALGTLIREYARRPAGERVSVRLVVRQAETDGTCRRCTELIQGKFEARVEELGGQALYTGIGDTPGDAIANLVEFEGPDH